MDESVIRSAFYLKRLSRGQETTAFGMARRRNTAAALYFLTPGSLLHRSGLAVLPLQIRFISGIVRINGCECLDLVKAKIAL